MYETKKTQTQIFFISSFFRSKTTGHKFDLDPLPKLYFDFFVRYHAAVLAYIKYAVGSVCAVLIAVGGGLSPRCYQPRSFACGIRLLLASAPAVHVYTLRHRGGGGADYF